MELCFFFFFTSWATVAASRVELGLSGWPEHHHRSARVSAGLLLLAAGGFHPKTQLPGSLIIYVNTSTSSFKINLITSTDTISQANAEVSHQLQIAR